eukprot:Nk52_evm1s2430 gene=Nk52_evmTU1s2430
MTFEETVEEFNTKHLLEELKQFGIVTTDDPMLEYVSGMLCTQEEEEEEEETVVEGIVGILSGLECEKQLEESDLEFIAKGLLVKWKECKTAQKNKNSGEGSTCLNGHASAANQQHPQSSTMGGERSSGEGEQAASSEEGEDLIQKAMREVALKDEQSANESNEDVSATEHKRREALLARYAYDEDGFVEDENGNVEILYKDRSGKGPVVPGGDIMKNTNLEQVKEMEKMRKLQHQKEHQAKVERDKLQQEKEKLKKEKEKRRTQKREKRRM